jgi:ABC-2 type transport system permease protein
MISSLTAELLVLRKRASSWVLLGIWVFLAMLFSYLLPYLSYIGSAEPPVRSALPAMLPEGLTDTLLAGFPFFGGVLALILGVLAVGSDFGWDTLKTLFTQRPSRLRILAAKLAALAVALVPFVLAVFTLGAIASVAIAWAEGAPIAWPSVGQLVAATSAGWFMLIVWAFFGVLLGVATQGTAMAIGIGILYALVIEGIVSAIISQVGWLEGTVQYSLRANAYSLVAALGAPTSTFADNGPGAYFGPYVDMGQALIVLTGYITIFVGLAAMLLQRRDIT